MWGQRRAAMNDIRQMEAQPLASCEMQLDGTGEDLPIQHNNKNMSTIIYTVLFNLTEFCVLLIK